ncbi:MAG TPA: FmdE family protein [Anaerolineales bacterium]|nr:FmdE family protein [Anaerolineales bacterium]
MNIQSLLEASARKHSHLCPRQILGVRIGLRGIAILGLKPEEIARKRLLIIAETDGCFIDGLIAATGCDFGHRTLRVEDYGKVAATFVDTKTERCVRIAPTLDVRENASSYAPDEPRHYFAQLKAYQIMPDEEMMMVQEVNLNMDIAQIVSRPGARANCDGCGEEIINQRETHQNGLILCHFCAHGGYYAPKFYTPAPLAITQYGKGVSDSHPDINVLTAPVELNLLQEATHLERLILRNCSG